MLRKRWITITVLSTDGQAPFFEKVVNLSADIVNNMPAKSGKYRGTGKDRYGNHSLETTAAHELAHSAGLRHLPLGLVPGNLMNRGTEPNTGKNVDMLQFLLIERYYNQGLLNKGRQKNL